LNNQHLDRLEEELESEDKTDLRYLRSELIGLSASDHWPENNLIVEQLLNAVRDKINWITK